MGSVCARAHLSREKQSCKLRVRSRGRPHWNDISVKSGKMWRREVWRRKNTAAEGQAPHPEEAHCQESSRNTRTGQAQQRGQGLEAELVMGPPGGHREYRASQILCWVLLCASWGCCLFYQRGGGEGKEGKRKAERREERSEEHTSKPEIHENRENQSYRDDVCGLPRPTLPPSKSEQQIQMMLMPPNKGVKNWFSPTPIRQSFFLTSNFTNQLESNYHPTNL